MSRNRSYVQNVLSLPEGTDVGWLKFGRGSQVAPKKVAVSIRLSPQVVAHFRCGGPRWQTRIDELLCYWVAVSGRRARLLRLLEAQRRVEVARKRSIRRPRRPRG